MSSQASDRRAWPSSSIQHSNPPKPMHVLPSPHHELSRSTSRSQLPLPKRLLVDKQNHHNLPYHSQSLNPPLSSRQHPTPSSPHNPTTSSKTPTSNPQPSSSNHTSVPSLQLQPQTHPVTTNPSQHHQSQYEPITRDSREPPNHQHSKYALPHINNDPIHQEKDQSDYHQINRDHVQHSQKQETIPPKDITNERSPDFKYVSHPSSHPKRVHTPTTSTEYPNNNSVQATAARKRQFRFSVHDDIKLLELVKQHNPYGAAYGSRILKWQNIAQALRQCDINIDFRRARDRTNLLLEQWRDKEFSLLRRSGSGNHEDQQKKEQLLEETDKLEQASRPRDTSSEWHLREQGIKRDRERVATTMQPIAPNPDKSLQPTLPVFSSVEPKPVMPAINGLSNHQTQLPPITQNPDVPYLPQIQPKASSHLVTQTPTKLMRNEDGYRINSASYSEQLYTSLPGRSNQPPSGAQASERRSPLAIERTPYSNDANLYQSNNQSYRKSTPPVLGGTSPDMIGVSRRPNPSAEDQNIQLCPSSVFPASNGSKILEDLLKRFGQLEQTVTNLYSAVDKLGEESRIAREQKKEEERRLAEQMTKMIEQRNQEREESLRREQAWRSEFERLFSILSHNKSRFNKERERSPD